MESLYFDTIQFLYHFALAVIVGGGLVLGAAVAPAVFRTVKSRGEAGTIFGAALAGWDGLAIFSVIVIVITSALKAGFEITGAPELRLIVRWIALAVLAAAVLYSSGWANPVARSLRAQTPAWDDLPESSPFRRVGIIAGLVALALS